MDLFDEYFKVLNEYCWLHDFKMSEFCLRQVWRFIPSTWETFVNNVQLSDCFSEFLDGVSEGMPDSLKRLVDICNKLRILQKEPSFQLKHSFENKEKKINLTDKKGHEIERFVPLIESVCVQIGCSVVVDIGCGLGYLCEVLSSKFELVVGIDCAEGHCDKAAYRLASKNLPNVKFLAMTIHDSELCWQKIVDFVHQFVRKDISQKFALIGLHCCGDLQPLILKMLSKIDQAVVALTVGCCYHKMIYDNCHASFPNNFPLCSSLKEKLSCSYEGWRLNKYSLRLASQDSVCRWKNKTKEFWSFNRKNVLFRSVVECLTAENIQMNKTKRHLVRPIDMENFDTYVTALFQRAEFSAVEAFNTEDIRQKLVRLYQDNVGYSQYIDIFTLLQILMQGVLESLLLLDRLEFTKEFCDFAKLVPIFDATVSPRNMLLIGSKVYLNLNINCN